MALKLITAAAAPLVTLAEAKAHLRVFHDDENDYITALVETATGHIDGASGWLGRALGTQTWELYLDGFPDDRITLPLPPLQDIVSVSYTADDGTAGTVTDYREFGIGHAHMHGYILPAYDDDWPDTRDMPEAVVVKFTAGYTTIPKPIKHAVFLMIGTWFDSREDVTEMKLAIIPRGVDALLRPYQVWA